MELGQNTLSTPKRRLKSKTLIKPSMLSLQAAPGFASPLADSIAANKYT